MATKVTRKTANKKATSRAAKSKTTPARKTTSRVSTPMMDERVMAKTSSKRGRHQFRRSSLWLLAGIIIIAGLVFIFRGTFFVAMVNGQPVTRAEYNAELEKQSGKQVLNTLVTKKLILEEAEKKHVTVSDSEINTEVSNIENNLSKQGQKLSDALAVQGMTLDQLKDQIKYQKLIQKMIGNNITVTDAEVNDYIDKNKDNLPTGQSQDQLKTMVISQLKQQKLNDATQTWIADLQKNAKVQYFNN